MTLDPCISIMNVNQYYKYYLYYIASTVFSTIWRNLSLFVFQTQADQCRYVVGSILCENEEKADEELQRLYEKFGYKVISFPEVTCAVTSSFPNRCTLSPVCGAYRVYPELQQYIKVTVLHIFIFES